jgi:hypothetical protein
VKQLPILVLYFQAYDLENPVKNKLLTFAEIARETSDIISMQVMKKAIVNYDLETKVVGLSADNNNTNLGGLLRRSKESMLTKMKSQLKRNITGYGCNAHNIHNCAKTAFDSMRADIEALVTKIFVYFQI